MGTYAIDLQTTGIGLLLVRIVIGFVMDSLWPSAFLGRSGRRSWSPS
jgi:hypothetical protein